MSSKQHPNGKRRAAGLVRTIDSRAPKGEYTVAFDTGAAATGVLVGVGITIEPITLGMEETTRIDLSSHPLYEHLHRYCLSNPPRKG